MSTEGAFHGSREGPQYGRRATPMLKHRPIVECASGTGEPDICPNLMCSDLAQPLIPVLADERVVIQIRVDAAHAVDFGGLVARKAL